MTVKEYNKSVDLFSDNVYRFILKNLKETDKSKDVVQDTYEKLWINHEKVSFEKVKSYIFSTAYHAMIDLLRKEKRNAEFDQNAFDTYSHETQYSDIQEVLSKAIEKLPDTQRSVLMLRDYEGYSYNEIGEITNLKEAQVKVYIYRARMFLKNYIGSLEAVI